MNKRIIIIVSSDSRGRERLKIKVRRNPPNFNPKGKFAVRRAAFAMST